MWSFPSCSIHWHKKEIKNTWSLLSVRKFLYIAFIWSSSLIIMSTIVNLKYLVNVAEKDLVSSGFWSRFSRNSVIDWIESFLNNSSPTNKEIFFSVKAKNKLVWSLHRRGSSTQFMSYSDLSEKLRKYISFEKRNSSHSVRWL